MTTPYETLSKEEASSFLFGGQPQQQMAPPQAAPVEATPRKTKPIVPPTMGTPVAGELNPSGLVQQVTQANKAMQAQTPAPQAPSVVGALMDQLTSNWQIPALGLGALALGYGAYKLGQGTKETSKEGLKSRDIMNRIDPTMDSTDLSKPTPTSVPIPKEETQTKFAKDFEIKYGVPLATAEEISGGKITKQWEADIVGNAIKNNLPITVKKEAPIIASTTTTQPATMANPIDSQPLKSQFDTSKLGQPFDVTKLGESRDPLANRGFQYPVVPTAEPTPVASTEKSTSKSPKKEPAVLTFKSAKDIPEGFVFRPDVGNLDRSLGNILGLEHRANAREMFTGGKPFGQFTGSGPTAFNDEISRLTTNYFQKLQSEIPETILSRDARKAQGIPSDFGTYATKTNFGKAAKVAGVAGTLIAAADIANAAQKGNIGEAALRSADLATDYIPGVAQFKQGLSPFEAGAPTLGEKQLKAFENAKKLGSPYRSVPPR